MESYKLIPAVCRKEEIIGKSMEMLYDDDMFYYNGWLMNEPIRISDSDENGEIYRYAVISAEKLIGYISYRIDWYSSQAYAFGLISFDKGNILNGYAINDIFERLIHECGIHRIEFRCIGGNPAKDAYDRYCKKHGGRCIELRDSVRDKYGKYHNSYIYEIIKEERPLYGNVSR